MKIKLALVTLFLFTLPIVGLAQTKEPDNKPNEAYAATGLTVTAEKHPFAGPFVTVSVPTFKRQIIRDFFVASMQGEPIKRTIINNTTEYDVYVLEHVAIIGTLVISREDESHQEDESRTHAGVGIRVSVPKLPPRHWLDVYTFKATESKNLSIARLGLEYRNRVGHDSDHGFYAVAEAERGKTKQRLHGVVPKLRESTDYGVAFYVGYYWGFGK
jgi:hypothetical protein